MNLFGHKPKQKPENMREVECAIGGMHCSSCAMNIDGALEDLPGVVSADTSYAKATTKVTYDEALVRIENIKKAIEAEGYTVTISSD